MTNFFPLLLTIAWGEGAWGIAATNPGIVFPKAHRADSVTTLDVKSVDHQMLATFAHQGCVLTYKSHDGFSLPSYSGTHSVHSRIEVDPASIDGLGAALCIDLATFESATPCTHCTISSDWDTGEVTCSFPDDDAREYSGEAQLKYRLPSDVLTRILSRERVSTGHAASLLRMLRAEARYRREHGVSLYRRVGLALRIAQLHMRLRSAKSHEASNYMNYWTDKTWWNENAAPRICQIIRTKFWPRMLKYVTARLGPWIAAETLQRAKIKAEKLETMTININKLLEAALVPRRLVVESTTPARVYWSRETEQWYPPKTVNWWIVDSQPECKMYFWHNITESDLVMRLAGSCLNHNPPAFLPFRSDLEHRITVARKDFDGEFLTLTCYKTGNGDKEYWKYTFPSNLEEFRRAILDFYGYCSAIEALERAFALEAEGRKEGLRYAR